MRETLRQGLHHVIQTGHIPVCGLALPLMSQIFGIAVGKDPVHVPFDIGNIRAGKKCGHFFNDIIDHLRICQIKDSLISSLRVFSSRNIHRPVRMRPVTVTVHIYHLRLHPDTKGKSERVDLVRQSPDTVRQLLFIRFPVTQRTLIILTLPEPAVIHHKQLYPCLFSSLRKF